MSEPEWQYVLLGDWTFRVRQRRPDGMLTSWASEAKRGPFKAKNILYETDPCWFEYGRTRDEAINKLKAEVLS